MTARLTVCIRRDTSSSMRQSSLTIYLLHQARQETHRWMLTQVTDHLIQFCQRLLIPRGRLPRVLRLLHHQLLRLKCCQTQCLCHITRRLPHNLSRRILYLVLNQKIPLCHLTQIHHQNRHHHLLKTHPHQHNHLLNHL